MKDPKRLIDVQTGRGLQLLSAARAVPAPPAEAYEKVLATMSTQASVAVAVTPALGIVKWIVVGVVIGAGGSAIGFVASRAGSTPKVLPAAAPPSPPSRATALVRQHPALEAFSSAPVVGARKIPSRPAAAASAWSALAEEIAVLDLVRRALSHNESRAALVGLDDYVARFPAGQLTPEAALLRVRALAAADRTAEAKVLAEQLLETSPDPEYAARVREAANGAAP